MKHIKWRILIITCLVCLAPCVFGFFMYDTFPETMAIHFNINNEPDNFAHKNFVLFGLPLFMMVVQIFMCIVYDIKDKRHGEGKAITVAKWIVPIITAGVYAVTVAFSKGALSDIRRPVLILLGVVYVLTGNYIPKFDYIKHYKLDTDTARRINRVSGFGLVIFGLLFIISAFLPVAVSIACLILFIVCACLIGIYTLKVSLKK